MAEVIHLFTCSHAEAIFLFYRRRDDDGLDGVFSKIEEVVLASQGLAQVSTALQELSDIARQSTRALVLTQEQSRPIKATFTCSVCRGQFGSMLICYLQPSPKVLSPIHLFGTTANNMTFN